MKYLSGDALRHSLHWAFPQAYYSVYTITQAFFIAIGYTERTHASVIRKFGSEVKASRYPASLAFGVEGARATEYVGIIREELPSPLYSDLSDARIVDAHICRFLSGTRKIDLLEKRQSIKFLRKDGKAKKSLKQEDWQRVSQTLGPTSLLSLLYRKRIKSNYRDIDTLLSPALDPDRLYQDLLSIVAALNLVHEALVLTMFESKVSEKFFASLNAEEHRFVFQRAADLRGLAA